MLGVNQATVSRWESGRTHIDDASLGILKSHGLRLRRSTTWPKTLVDAHIDDQWPALITHFRLSRNVSQEFISDSIGCSVDSISRWERGMFKPDLKSQIKLRDLLLKPLDSDRELQQLLRRTKKSPGHVSLHWGPFVIARSKLLQQTHIQNRHDIHAFSNLHEIYDGKVSPWMKAMDQAGLLRGEVPMSHAHYRMSEADARTVVCFSVPSREVRGLSLSVHYLWETEMDDSLDGEFRLLHADELIV